MSTELKPMELKDITLMSKLKSRMQESNPAISSIRMAAKSLNDSKAQETPGDDSSDSVEENGVSDGKESEEDEMKGVKRDPKGKKLCDQLLFRFEYIPEAIQPALGQGLHPGGGKKED